MLIFGRTWNGNASSSTATDWKFELGASNAADKLAITGNFTKGTGTKFWFDFQGSSFNGTFDLVSWTGSLTGFNVDASEFDYTNLGGGRTGTFSIINASNGTLQFTAIPEPTSALAGLLLAAGLLRRRRGNSEG